MPSTTNSAGKLVSAVAVREVAGLTTADEAGRLVPVTPVRYVGSMFTTDALGRPIDALPVVAAGALITLDDLGRAASVLPVRTVAGLTATDERGRPVPVLPVYLVGGGGGGGGTALTAPPLIRVSGPTDYGALLQLGLTTRPVDWIDGDILHFSKSADPLFGSGVTTTTVTLSASSPTASLGTFLDSVTSGSVFFKCYVEPGPLNPGKANSADSPTVNVGDTVAPTLSGGGSTSSAERAAMAVTVTASELSYFTIGGTDAALLELNSTAANTSVVVRLIGNTNLDYETKASYSYVVTATDFAGNPSAPLACTHTVTNVVENPSGLTNFTTQTNATLSQSYTSNAETVTILGVQPFTVTNGTLVVGGVDLGSSGTVSSGSWQLKGNAPGSNNSTNIVTVNAGGDAPQFTATYQIQTPTSIPQFASLGWRFENNLSDLKQSNAGTTAVATAGDPVGYWADLSGNARHLIAPANATDRPTFQVTSGINELQLDGVNDIMKWSGAAAANLYTASGFTAMICMRTNSAGTVKDMLGASSSTASGFLGIVGTNSTTAANGNSRYSNDASTAIVASSVNHFTNAHPGTNKVIIVVDDGTGLTWWVDGVAGTRQAYTRSGVMTLDDISLGGIWRLGVALSNCPGYVQGLLIWPQINLTSGEIATATTYGGAFQGRSL